MYVPTFIYTQNNNKKLKEYTVPISLVEEILGHITLRLWHGYLFQLLFRSITSLNRKIKTHAQIQNSLKSAEENWVITHEWDTLSKA